MSGSAEMRWRGNVARANRLIGALSQCPMCNGRRWRRGGKAQRRYTPVPIQVLGNNQSRGNGIRRRRRSNRTRLLGQFSALILSEPPADSDVPTWVLQCFSGTHVCFGAAAAPICQALSGTEAPEPPELPAPPPRRVHAGEHSRTNAAAAAAAAVNRYMCARVRALTNDRRPTWGQQR